MNKLLLDFIKTRDALYSHCGFKEDWITFPINSDGLNSVWKVENDSPLPEHDAGDEHIATGYVRWADNEDKLNNVSAGDFFSAELVKHRFFQGKSVFRGPDLTLIIGEPHVDGMRWLYVFDSHKEVKANGPAGRGTI